VYKGWSTPGVLPFIHLLFVVQKKSNKVWDDIGMNFMLGLPYLVVILSSLRVSIASQSISLHRYMFPFCYASCWSVYSYHG